MSRVTLQWHARVESSYKADLFPPSHSAHKFSDLPLSSPCYYATAIAQAANFRLLLAWMSAFLKSKMLNGRLQNAIKYCTDVAKTGQAGKETNNLATV